MTFTSPLFLASLFAVMAVYWAAPSRFRWVALLVVSYLLYASVGPEYLLVLAGVTLTTYAGGRLLAAGWLGPRRRRALLGIAIATTLLPLLVFKYAEFGQRSLLAAAGLLGLSASHGEPSFSLLLPLGISFYTLKGLSYLIDVSRDGTHVERRLGRYALSISFFPQIFAGPIERPRHFLAQLDRLRPFDREAASAGLRLMALGFFKKLVIADQLALVVNQLYGDLHAHVGLPVLVAIVGFSLQIYCDFSGYSDIANGVGRLFGFEPVENFRRPYFARGFREFWRRWHISLMTWFRDYLYIPLGGNRVSPKRQSLNLMAIFIVSGLWHGAAWTFVIWGALHGLFVVAESLAVRTGRGAARLVGAAHRARPRAGSRARATAQTLITFILATLAWIFFRAPHLNDALYVLSHAPRGLATQLHGWGSLWAALREAGLTPWTLSLLALSVALLALVDSAEEWGLRSRLWATPTAWQRRLAYYGLVAWILVGGAFGQNAFLYFRF